MDIKNTKSNSSASLKSMGVPDYNGSDDRISETGKEGEYGDMPIRETGEVKYKQYENDKRMTEDFGTSSENGDCTAGLDGTNEIEPEGEPAKSYVSTNFSKR